MKNECNIIRDILPLYAEDMVSTDTSAFVEEHLTKCAECRAELENLKSESLLSHIPSDKYDTDALPLKTIKKKWKNKKIALICFTALITTVMSAVVAYNYRGMLCGIEHGGYSAPAGVAFLYAIPFLIVIIVCAILAVTFHFKSK